jgi:hypothetical protein
MKSHVTTCLLDDDTHVAARLVPAEHREIGDISMALDYGNVQIYLPLQKATEIVAVLQALLDEAGGQR